MTRKVAALLILLVLVFQALPAQVDRTTMPGPGPAPAVAFPAYEKHVTPNGIRVIIVRNTELPTIDIQLLIDRKAILEGDTAGYVDIAGQMLRTGTATKTKDQLDDAIDLIGASIRSSGTNVFASGLSGYTEALMALTADIVLHPSFPKEELQKLVTQTVSGLKYRKTDPEMIVEVVRDRILYGEKHPYGEVATEETAARVTREKCLELYTTYFRPNGAILAIVGDVNADTAMALVNKYFGGWQQGPIPAPAFEPPKGLDGLQVALVDRPGAPQSVIRVAGTVKLPRTSPDVIPSMVMNTVLGGGSAFRLFSNLREKHAYTYGAYSSIGADELIGSFSVKTSAKSSVTDSALNEILTEIRRIRDEKVSDKELQMAKNYLSGAFVRSLENASSVASNAIDIERYKLPAAYYQNYLKNIDTVTADDVQRTARVYLAPDKMLIALVGPASEIKSRLGKFGAVAMVDEEGKPIVVPSAALTMKPDEVLSRFIEKTGGKATWAALKDRTMEFSGKMQNFVMKIKNVQKAPNKLYTEMEVTGMFKQQMAFDGKKAWMVSPQGSGEITGEQLEGIKQQAVMNFYAAYKKMGFSATISGMKTIKGKDCYELTFTRGKGDVIRHYFAADDFLKLREVKLITTPQGSVEQITDFADYKEFKGLLLPTKYEQNAMGQVVELTLEVCTINAGVKDDVFKKPASK